jgi:hypothetical protein
MNCKWKGTGSVGNDIPGKNKPKDRQELAVHGLYV